MDVDVYHQSNGNAGTHIIDAMEESVVVGDRRRASDLLPILVAQGRNAARANLCLRVTNLIIRQF